MNVLVVLLLICGIANMAFVLTNTFYDLEKPTDKVGWMVVGMVPFVLILLSYLLLSTVYVEKVGLKEFVNSSTTYIRNDMHFEILDVTHIGCKVTITTYKTWNGHMRKPHTEKLAKVCPLVTPEELTKIKVHAIEGR